MRNVAIEPVTVKMSLVGMIIGILDWGGVTEPDACAMTAAWVFAMFTHVLQVRFASLTGTAAA